MFCSKCGANNPEEGKFCSGCGTPLTQEGISSAPKAPTPGAQVKVGEVRKCPACGAAVSAFSTACSDCGHEFAGIEASGTIRALFAKLEQIEKETLLAPLKGLDRMAGGELAEERRQLEIKQKKATVIRNFPIPNTREELLQLLHFIQPKIAEGSSGDVNVQDWTVKFGEIIGRAKVAYKGDGRMLKQLAEMEESSKTSFLTSVIRRFLSSSKQFKMLIVIGLIAPLLIIAISMGVSGEKAERAKEAARLEKIVDNINTSVSTGNYKAAMTLAAQLKWEDHPLSSKGQVLAWDEKRELMISTIQKLIDKEEKGK